MDGFYLTVCYFAFSLLIEVYAAKLAKMKVIRMERDEPNSYLLEEAEYLGQEDALIPSFSALLII